MKYYTTDDRNSALPYCKDVKPICKDLNRWKELDSEENPKLKAS